VLTDVDSSPSVAAPLAAQDSATKLLHLAVLCDFPEEGWPSMDLCADMLLAHLPPAVAGHRVVPRFRNRFSRLPWLGRRQLARNADRLLNRLWDYSRHLRPANPHFEAFHVCDHSYAHLLHSVPAGRGGVLCHDLDTFRCLLEPRREPRPWWFRRQAGHILAGLQKAAVVFVTTQALRQQIVTRGLLDPGRLVYAPNGVSPDFNPDDDHEPPAFARDTPFVLHVGSCIPRKRIDVLLDVFAEVRRRVPGLRLVQVGGAWTAEQAAQAQRRGLSNALRQVRGLSRGQLAALYRAAAVVLLPSEAEGFGLPIIEALASGAAVVASDLPVLREVGGDAVLFCPVADVPAWSDAVTRVLADPAAAPPCGQRLAWAQRFSWSAQATTIADAYLRLLGKLPSKA
jgi:glycosyltransferase involved in cell wall biosynthesis